MRAVIAREAALWRGETSPWAYVVLRVGLAAIVLARTTDWLRPWIEMDHHGWSRGLDHTAVGVAPALCSPLVPFLPSLGAGTQLALGVLRTVLAFALLLGVRPRASAAALALVGYGLMALDRYRYFHHLHLLWISIALLALAPSDARLALLPARSRTGVAARWPLQLVRAQVLIVYAAAGVAKLSSAWLSGELLRFWATQRQLGGALAALVPEHAQPLAVTIAALELALVPLLALPRARPLGIALAIALHAGVESSMVVSTFGATMLLLVTAFLPWDRAAGPQRLPSIGSPAPGPSVRARSALPSAPSATASNHVRGRATGGGCSRASAACFAVSPPRHPSNASADENGSSHPLHAARECATVLGLHHQVDVITLHREVRQTHAEALADGEERREQPRERALGAQVPHVLLHLHRDEHGRARGDVIARGV